jgi:signal transduction histidine kinase
VARSRQNRLLTLLHVGLPVGVGLFGVLLALEPQDPAAPKIVGVVVGAGQGAALWWRRSHPELVMAIAVAGGAASVVLAPEGLFPYAGLVALGSLAAARPPRRSLPALAALLGVTALNYPIHPDGDVTFAMAFPVLVWALGEATRNRRAAIAEAARRAVGDEQARIARELHDVVAHTVSVIVVQAAAADEIFAERPDQARAALRSIEAAGRDALAELRRLLVAVRAGEGGQPGQPQPGLDRLGELAASLRAAGLDVALRREAAAAAPALPAGVDLSAYRIVQEALTNTVRHADARRAEVTVRAADGVLEIDVRDDGCGTSTRRAQGAGRGIAGMRERAAMLGGTLDAGPLPGGGFRVHARLPLEGVR